MRRRFGVLLVVVLFVAPVFGKKPSANHFGIEISSPRQPEGNSGGSACGFIVTLPAPAPATGTEIQWETKDGSARAKDGDYEPAKGMVRFKEGERQRTIEIQVNGDMVRETDETVLLRCWPAKQGKGDKKENIATGTGTIVNDDNHFSLTLTPVTDFEGHRLTTKFSFLAILNARVPLGNPISIPWWTVPGSADENDFRPAKGVLIFRPGDRYKTIDVVVYHDEEYEPVDETFGIKLDLPEIITGDQEVAGTIKDDFQGRDSSRFAGYFVCAKTGRDSNPGTASAPFGTLAKGIDALKAGDTLYLREGRHYADNLAAGKLQGTAAKPIHIRAFPGEYAVVAATRELGTDGWVPVGREDANYRKYFGKTTGASAIGKIYKKSIGFVISRLYVDGKEIGIARWPDAPVWSDLSWNRWQSRRGVAGPREKGGDDGQTQTRIVDGTDPRAEPDMEGWRLKRLADLPVCLNGATVAGNLGGFVCRSARITDHTPGNDFFLHEEATNKIRISRKAGLVHEEAIRYYVSGLPLLDTEEEWGFAPSESGGTVYVWLKDGRAPSEAAQIEGRVADYLLVCDRKKGPCPSHLKIDGLHFFGGGINLDGAEHATLRNSTVTYFPDIGFYGSRHCVLVNNEFRYGDRSGIDMGESLRSLVENNLIEHTDPIAGNSLGCDQNSLLPVVRGNTIRYSGSSVTLGVSTAGIEEFEAIVESNYFDKTGLFAWDGATIQRTNQGAANTVVRYNWFLESHRGAMRLDAGPYPILYAKIYRNVMHNGHKGFGMNGEYLDVFHNTGFESRTKEHVKRDPYTDLSNPRGDLNFRVDNSPMEDMNRYSVCMNNSVDVMDPSNDNRPGVMEKHGPDWKGLVEGVPIRGQLRDPDNRDFRPWQSGSALVDAGASLKNQKMRWALKLEGMKKDDIPVNEFELRDIEVDTTDFLGTAPDLGAYEAGGSVYWIPGYREDTASHPIPFDAAQNVRDNAQLIFRPALQAIGYDVYFGSDKTKTADAARGTETHTAILVANENIFTPKGLKPNTTYYWRVDTVLDKKGRVEKGRLWTFTTGRFVAGPVLERPVYNTIPSGGTDVLVGGKKMKSKSGEPKQVFRYLFRNRGTTSLDLVDGSVVEVVQRENCEVRVVREPGSRTLPPGAAVFFDLEIVPKGKDAFSADLAVVWKPSRDGTKKVYTYTFGINGN